MSAVRTALVIGSGIAGPVAAAALRRAGLEVTVYEAYPAHSNGIGSALALAPNGLAALGIIGAEEAVRRTAFPITSTAMSVAGKNLGALPSLPDLPALQMVDRGDLHRVLQDRAAGVGVGFEYDKRLIGVQESPDAVTARFADGSSATAEVLIGADGVRSTVRTLIDLEAPGAGYTGLLGFGGIVEADVSLDPGTMVFAFGTRAYYLYWTMPDGRVAWGANLPSKEYLTLAQARAVSAADWLRTLRRAYAGDTPGQMLAEGTTAQSLEVLGDIHIMPPVPHWSRGRMVLVGDAVHAPSNSTGQGASLAIESAVQLARCLRDLPDYSSGFAAYEGLRRARVQKITKRGARINHAKAPGPIARKIMQWTMPVMFRAMNPEKSMGWEQRYAIDWDAPVEWPGAAG